MASLSDDIRRAPPVAAPVKPVRQPTRLRYLARDVRFLAMVAYLSVLVLVAVFPDLFTRYSPTQQDLLNTLSGPSAAHWLGTDDLGRDVLSRLIHGAGPSLYSCLLAVSIAVIVGVPLGVLAGYAGGWVDAAISRLIDAMISFPTILFAIGVTGVLGVSLTNGMLAIGLAVSPSFARLARAETLVVKQELYVEAARVAGAGPWRIMTRHILPNAVQSVIVKIGLMLSVALLAESSLSFLGMGVQAPQASWGGMLARAYNYMEVVPQQMYAPGIAILLTALAFNALGEAMRIGLDPRSPRA